MQLSLLVMLASKGLKGGEDTLPMPVASGGPAGFSTADSLKNASIKFIVLIALTVQNATHALMTRYSQGILKESYSSTEVVLVAEVVKLIVSAYLTVADKSGETDAKGEGLNKLLWLTMNSRKIILLVILYSTANILAFYALERVEASVYTVVSQGKIVTTAVFAIIFLGRQINATKWRALTQLVIGCCLVASPAFSRQVCVSEADAGAAEDTGYGSAMVGVSCVLIMISISGYSSIYFEGMLKKSNERITIWERNFQLALFSIIFLIAVVAGENLQQQGGIEISEMHSGLFQGWTLFAVLISLVQATGGLLVASTLKYADAILKTLATSGAIVISALMNWALLGGTLDIFVCMGCVSTILAIFNYILDVDPPKALIDK